MLRVRTTNKKKKSRQTSQQTLIELLSAKFPQPLAEKITGYFVSLKRNYTLGHYGDSVQSAEKLSQALAKALLHILGEPWSMNSDVELGTFEEKLRKAISQGILPPTAIGIAYLSRTLRAIRSKKDVAHMRSRTVTKIDADLAVASSSWMLAELLVYVGARLEDEHVSADIALDAHYPLVEKIGTEYVVHYNGSARERILVFLYWMRLHGREPTLTDITRAIPNVARKTVQKVLARLVKNTFVVKTNRNTYVLTTKGVAEVGRILQQHG